MKAIYQVQLFYDRILWILTEIIGNVIFIAGLCGSIHSVFAVMGLLLAAFSAVQPQKS